jgi:predicted amidohydrolase
VKIGLAQLNSQNDKTVNLAAAERAVAALAARGCDLVLLPEMFNYRWTDEANRRKPSRSPAPQASGRPGRPDGMASTSIWAV